MDWIYYVAWVLTGLFASIWVAKFFNDGVSLFGVISCCVLGPFALIGPIVWTLGNIRIF